MANTGVFQYDFKEWNRKPPIGHDWKNFQTALCESASQVEGKLAPHRRTTFPCANADDDFISTADHQSNTVEALANLATATAADRATVATLKDTIAQLSL